MRTVGWWGVPAGSVITRKRGFRLRVQAYVAANHVMDTVLLCLFAWVGTVGWRAPAIYALVAGLISISFYLLMARGISEHMPDPLVDRVQRVCAWVLQLVFVWKYPQLAFVFLNVLLVIFGFSFHQPRIGWRRLALEWLLLAAGTFVMVHQLGASLQPPMDTPAERALVWTSYVLTLARCAYLGLRAGRLSTRLQRVNKDMRELNARLDARVEERTREIERSNVHLSELNRQLQAFAGSMAHDFRQPLITIGGHASLLRERLAAGGAGPNLHLERIAQAVRRMDQMCNRLTQLLNLNSVDLDPREFDLTRLAVEVAQEVRQRYPGREVAMEIGPGMQVNADRRLVKVALDVLVDNCFKFAADGRAARVHVGCEHAADMDRVSVSDDGPGFSVPYTGDASARLPGLLELYEESGTGLGLAIVDTVARRHGAGTFACESHLGGACVGFALARPGLRPPASAA